jgi:membrane-bound ClpP family serine protease
MKNDDVFKKMNETWSEVDRKMPIDIPEAEEIIHQLNCGEKRYQESLRRDLIRFILLACVLLSLYIIAVVHIMWAFYVIQFTSAAAVIILLVVERRKRGVM